jgi:1,2-diacylglycerol 3-alpha-glucosyltransferase
VKKVRTQKTVALLCSGIGDVLRGSETFFATYFVALRAHASSDVRFDLFSGGRRISVNDAKKLWRLSRESRLARLLGYPRIPTGGPWTRGFWTESVTYALSFLAYTQAFGSYDIVHVTDSQLKNIMCALKRNGLLQSKLVFSVGVSYVLLKPGIAAALNNDPVDVYHFSNSNDFEVAKRDQIIPLHKMHCIPQGITTRVFSSGDYRAGEVWLAGKGLRTQRPVVVSVGTFDRGKNMDRLLEVIAALADVQWVVFGDGNDAQLLARAHSTLGSRFVFTKETPERIANVFAAATLFVLPSMTEGFGRSIIEATVSGIPCLVHDDPWFGHLIPDAAFRVDMSQVDCMSNKVELLLRQEVAFKKRFRATQEHVTVEYDWQHLVRRYEEALYRR